tara:strand:+ start:29 stop:463 length:435 start_codon:yes stop_codon:yes gene_type:complete
MPWHIAQSDEDIGYKYYQKGDYEKALSVWKKELSLGKKETIYNIGLLYFFGKGVKQDLSIAFEYCQKAALMGSARAQNNIAYMYIEGLGTEKNYVAAYAWSKIAIENGYNSQKIKDDASIHLTPAMRYDAGKIINNLRKEIRYD